MTVKIYLASTQMCFGEMYFRIYNRDNRTSAQCSIVKIEIHLQDMSILWSHKPPCLINLIIIHLTDGIVGLKSQNLPLIGEADNKSHVMRG